MSLGTSLLHKLVRAGYDFATISFSPSPVLSCIGIADKVTPSTLNNVHPPLLLCSCTFFFHLSKSNVLEINIIEPEYAVSDMYFTQNA